MTDKSGLGYIPIYKELLAGRTAPSILELGIADGSSLHMWRELFPDSSTIVGVDIVLPVVPVDAAMILADQANPRLPAVVSQLSPGGYDLIIDDASHRGTPSTASFKNLWPLVKPGAWYVLEDWPVGMKSNPHYGNFEGDSMLKLAESFISLIRPSKHLMDLGQNFIRAGDPGTPDEVRYRYGMAMIHKQEA